MDSNKYISEIDGKYSIDRIFNDKCYNFGVYDSFDEALDKLEYLEEEGWPISKDIVENNTVVDNLGLSLDNIEKNEGKFVVFKNVMGEKIIFGEYETIEDAKRIRNNLISNAWESIEENTRSKYAKYIRKHGEKYIVTRIYKGKYYGFGQFNTFEEALAYREELISNNWNDLNIPLKMRYGKYISYNGIMYSVQKMLKGKVHVYGHFNTLENAIKQRDWLVENNWSRLEVPDDSNKFIHKQGDNYLIYLRTETELKYYGTFSSLEEAREQRNLLIENNWVLDDSNSIEKISEYVYFDGEFYFIEKVINDQKRIYGVYKNEKQALYDEQLLISSEWEDYYAVQTEDYPYGENIVPFDYIFILEKNENNVKEEIGTYSSFKEAVKAKYEILDRTIDENDKLIFSVKVGKSYKNRGWSIIRDSTYDLIPKLPYEDDCDIIVDGIPTSAKLNILPRIFYDRTDSIVKHLENLATKDPNSRINVELILNKNIDSTSNNENENSDSKILNTNNNEKIELKNSINELKEQLINLEQINESYLEKYDNLYNLVQELIKSNISVDEIDSISDSNLKFKLINIKNLINELKNN